jgi:opacity protein-like surface antigen
MRKYLIAAAVVPLALAMPALADETGPYVTIEGGAVKQERANVYYGGGLEDTDRFRTGWEGGAALGYDLGHFRVEAEGFYDRSSLKEQDRNGVALYRGNGLAGHTDTYAAMGNALLTLGHWGGIKAYAGGGVGWAHTNILEETGYVDAISDHTSGFAWQGLAGLTVPVSHNLDFGVRYRYFRPSDANKFTAENDTGRVVALRSHSLLATLTYNFGRTAPMMEQPAAPPPPPPPAATAPPAAATPAADGCGRVQQGSVHRVL